MNTPVGINNGNSYYMRSMRRVYIPAPSLITTTVPECVTVAALAERIATSYEAAVMVLRGGLVTAKMTMLEREFGRQLALLAEYADELAEVSK